MLIASRASLITLTSHHSLTKAMEIAPEDELLLHNINTLPQECKKYWSKRYNLFSRFDDGVYMTAELWYSVTPEALAIFIARLVKKLLPHARTILDVCCGGGGNAIQFAHYFPSVGAVDVNPKNLQCTVHNAAIYGVLDRIWTQVGDWNELSRTDNGLEWIPDDIPDKRFDFVFCSPPWGGPLYKKGGAFDVQAMQPFSMETLCLQMQQFSKNYAIFLPRTLDLDIISRVCSDLQLGCCRIMYLGRGGYTIGLLAMFGEEMMEEVDTADLIY